jgi:sialic acid synthase SpsE
MIHPSCVGDLQFLAKMAKSTEVLLLYVGGLTLGEIEAAVNTARFQGCEKIILQHGFQSYPTPIEENNLLFIPTLKRLFGLPVAFGDHTDGGDEFALVIPAVAVGLGAAVIEKHLTHDRALKGEDFESALDGATFELFVRHIRETERSLGNSRYEPLGGLQTKYRDVVRKRAVAAKTIAAGTTLTPDLVVYKRSKTGLYPEEIGNVMGRVATEEIPENGPIAETSF